MKSQKQTLSMYIHIPFCQKKCAYCDFLSFDREADHIEAYMLGLMEDISQWTLKNEYDIKSIFIGGGTPSILSPQHLLELMSVIRSHYQLTEDCEITMECNPGTLNASKVLAMKQAGINRISMGVQSLDADTLKILGRIHSDTVFYEQYDLLRTHGFDNINLDMMYALPHQSVHQFQEQLEKVLALEPEHLSVYGLIIEPGTGYEKLYDLNPQIFPDEETERNMYWLAHDILTVHGYEHYEISNYAKQGYHCKHNEVYWKLEPYIGFGLGAASYVKGERFERTRDLFQYMRQPTQSICNRQAVSDEALMEEVMFLGLRMLEGVDMNHFKALIQQDIMDVYKDVIDKLMAEGLLEISDARIRLTKRGIDISNYVMAQFIH